MSTTIYADAKTGTAVISLDTATVNDSNTVTLQVQATPVQQAPTTEAQLKSMETVQAISIGTVSADDSVSAVAIAGNLEYVAVHLDDVNGVTKTEPVEVIVLPDSWIAKDTMDKWTRLCYEQQKSVFEPLPYWFSIDEFPSSGITSGYNNSTIDFPVEPYTTEVFALTQTGSPFHKIDTNSSNKMIENIQTVYRKEIGKTTSQGSVFGYDTWKNFLLVDAEDDPVDFSSEGTYQFACYPVIDGKQVPMPPIVGTIESLTATGVYDESRLLKTINDQQGNFGYTQITQSFSGSEKAAFVPLWNGNNLQLYYYLPVNSNIHEIQFFVDDVLRGQIDTTQSAVSMSTNSAMLYKEGWISLGSFQEKLYRNNPFAIIAKRYHLTSRTGGRTPGRSFIDQLEFMTQSGMVRGDNFIVEGIPQQSNVENDGSFPLRLRGDLSALYKPDANEKAFQVDLSPESNWFKSIKEKRKVLRLRVSKIVKGMEIHVGNFILNPLAESGSNITGLCNLSQNLDFIEVGEDTDGKYLDFRYLSYAGPAGLLNSSVNEEHYYVFRVCEWTLGVEHGLITDQSIAWMVDPDGSDSTSSLRYRYDTWDEEHPVRRWRWMSPVSPKDDSVSRCSIESQGSNCHLVPVNSMTNTSKDSLPFSWVSVQDNFGWNVIYSNVLLTRGAEHLTWPYFSFRVNVGNYFNPGFRRAKIVAALYHQNNDWSDVELITITEGDDTFNTMSNPTKEMKHHSNITIAEFDEWSEVYDVRDFVSYQVAHHAEFNRLQPKDLYPTDEDSEPTEQQQEFNAEIKPENIVIPDPSVVITTEQRELYRRFLVGIAKQATDNVRQNWGIRYYIVFYGDFDLGSGNSVQELPMDLTPDGNGGLKTGMWGPAGMQEPYVLFDFEVIEQPIGNSAYLPASSRLTTDLVEFFTVTGGDSDDGDSGTPPVCGFTGATRNLSFPSGTNQGDISGDGTVDSYVSSEGEVIY